MVQPDPTRIREGIAGTPPALAVCGHFSIAELTHTDTGLPNQPDDVQWANLVRLVADALEPMRALVGPLQVNSAFRSLAVNRAIGGAKKSQHMKGQAADVVPLHFVLESAFQAVKASSIPFDQLILEPSWLHLSVPTDGVKPRRQTLRAYRDDLGTMFYTPA